MGFHEISMCAAADPGMGMRMAVNNGKSQVGTPRIAVVGCGAWGKNLVRNFKALGALAAVHDADADTARSNAAAAAEQAMRTGRAVPLREEQS
ncbi:MAG: hypothetical protein QGI13_02360 [Rhodospirillales bacterium]|jgi:UDP-N-acetylmuramoylalanine-D-glutamate ligase|nr:hypothetical protein [Rhodospirillales bacterium]